MDSALTSLLNQGSAWVAGGVAGAPARQPPPEHRPLRDLRGRRPAARGRGRQRPHVRAAVRGARARRAGRRRALRDQRRARRARRRARGGASARRSRASPPTHWVARAARGGRAGRPDQRRRRGVRARRGARAWSRPRSIDGVPLVRPPLRVDGERPPIRHGPPALDEHGDEIRAWLRAVKRLEPPSKAALASLSAASPQNLSRLRQSWRVAAHLTSKTSARTVLRRRLSGPRGSASISRRRGSRASARRHSRVRARIGPLPRRLGQRPVRDRGHEQDPPPGPSRPSSGSRSRPGLPARMRSRPLRQSVTRSSKTIPSGVT